MRFSLAVKSIIKPSEYHDSVTLMLVAKELTKFAGVIDAAVVIGTESNKSNLEQSRLLTAEAQRASPNDLVISINSNGSLDDALAQAEKLLNKKQSSEEGSTYKPKIVRGAFKDRPEANVAIISIAGRYAADEAWEALRKSLHVLLFSDNVTLEDEIALKTYTRDHGFYPRLTQALLIRILALAVWALEFSAPRKSVLKMPLRCLKPYLTESCTL